MSGKITASEGYNEHRNMRVEMPSNLASEAARLAVLDSLGILGTPAEQAYDDLTELAAFICGTAISLVSLVGKDKQFFKSAYRFPARETPRDQSFCAYTLDSAQTLIVEDALQDERFILNPLVTKDPKIRFYAGAPIFGEDGHVLGTLCVLDDKPRTLNAEQVRALEALARQATELLHQRYLNHQLQQSAEDLKRRTLQLGIAVEAGELGVYTWLLESDTTFWENDRLYEIFGRTREQGSLTSHQFLNDVVLTEDRASFLNASSQIKDPGDRLHWIGRFEHPSKGLRWIEVLGFAQRNLQGLLAVVGTIADVTERKRAELSAQADHERLNIALIGSKATTFDWTPEKGELIWGGVAPFGRSPQQLPDADSVFKIIHPDDTGALQSAIEGAQFHGEGYSCIFRVFWPDESLHWVRTAGQIIHPRPDQPRRVVGVNQDITELKLVEQKLASEQERLQIALRSNKATTFDWEPESDVVTWSGMPPFGVDPALIPTGISSFDFVHAEDREGLRSVLREAVAQLKDSYACEYRGYWSDGSTRWIRTSGRVLQETDGRIRVLGVNIDITDRRLAEEALVHSEKLSAVGRLASVISHEINNPLEAVTNLLYIVRGSPTLSRDDREHLEVADRELARVVQITAQTLSLHRNIDRPVDIDADLLVQELVSLFRTRLSASQIRVRLDLQEEVHFFAYEGDIRQLLNHLLGNAFDAMRTGGNLQIRTRNAIDPRTGRAGVSISIADNGPGIPLEERSRIFEAFHSTKGIHGTGLGLWIANRIAQKHRGSLTYRTRVGDGHGTIFRLWIPLVDGPSSQEGLSTIESGMSMGAGGVLSGRPRQPHESQDENEE